MTKRKILIADDNQLTLQSLQTTIPWNDWGYELIACAENGNEAWEKITSYHPDIVILDIHMPGLNGLEVAALIQKMEHPPLIILLSAYDRFTYAKTGLRLGVFDYLLKPLDASELKMILTKASDMLQRSAPQPEPVWRQDWCEKLLLESISGAQEAAQTLNAYLAEQWRCYGYSLLLVQQLSGDSGRFEAFRSEIRTLLRQEQIHSLSASCKEGRLLLIGFPTLRLTRDYQLEALYLANTIVERAKTCALQIFISISNYAESLTSLDSMYEQAHFALESRFFLENKSVIHYQSVMSKSVHNEYILSKSMQDLLQVIHQKDAEVISKSLDSFLALFSCNTDSSHPLRHENTAHPTGSEDKTFESGIPRSVFQNSPYDVDYIRTIFVQVAFAVSTILDGGSSGGKQLKTMDVIQTEIQQISHLQDLICYLREYTRGCLDKLRPDALPLSPQTQRVLDFLNLNYMKPLSLGDIAEDVGISESHLCRLLKNETGETFVNILNKIRIQKAEKLIRTGQYKVYEVAELVGFSNYAYFYQVFRKLTGATPTEYQKKSQKAK